jgi:type II secretory pathway predicted ATPase ExeA
VHFLIGRTLQGSRKKNIETMYLEHFHLNHSPFAEEPDPKIFFTEAGRGEVLKGLGEAFRGDKPLIKIIGSEGSGKTLLCRLLLRQLPGKNFDVVYLDNPVGSFDDLLHLVCLDLGMDPTVTTEQNMLSELRALLELRKDQQKKVVLIVDEAEKLFLAALERFMRAICEAGENHVLRVVLVGRPALDANLDQLTVYCSNVDIKDGYVLQPLTEDEIARYLEFRLHAAGLSPDNQEEIFTKGAVHKIFESAGGNIRLINILAEEALQASCMDKSFLVLLDHVVEQDEQFETKVGKISVSHALKSKKILFAGGGVLIVLLLLFLFMGREHKDSDQSLSVPEHQDARAVQEIPAAAGDHQGKPSLSPTPAEHQASSLGQDRSALQVDKPAVAELKADKVKKLPGTEKENAGKRYQPAAMVSANFGHASGEQLYQERVRASAKWLAGAYHNGYTVQLMMLASEQAAPNIKKMLTEEEYLAIKDKLYILRKKTSPPTLFVFYGTYDSMEQARQARNNMPLFLRKHHPYALSISDAMKKTED